MKLAPLDASLREHRFLAGLPDEMIRFFAGCTKNARCNAGSYLFQEGQPAEQVYLVRQGRLSLESHVPGRGKVTIESIEPGDVLGWSALFPPHFWHVDCRALEPVLCFAVNGNCLRDKLEADTAFGYAITRRLLQEVHHRLVRARLQQLDVYKSEAVG